MGRNQEPAGGPAGSQEPEKDQPPGPSTEKDQPSQQPERRGPGEVKKGVLDERDLRHSQLDERDTPRGAQLYVVRIDKLRGDCKGVHFNDECLASGVTEDQLEDLQEHFGRHVKYVTQEEAARQAAEAL